MARARVTTAMRDSVVNVLLESMAYSEPTDTELLTLYCWLKADPYKVTLGEAFIGGARLLLLAQISPLASLKMALTGKKELEALQNGLNSLTVAEQHQIHARKTRQGLSLKIIEEAVALTQKDERGRAKVCEFVQALSVVIGAVQS